ncbi:cell division protein ZapB [Magnetofaba australis]|uniref:Uncharacterized protein n=1 Tax=Magnetofaba australis IT-1 TaxID=1434232 RepID=A0A1Y2K8Z8_9PROT|nr:cell division protein ZapB [Magnetofaba australis]OSM07203.1 hypothetical protein MAIT1_03870 [Magnetofaba australis IT-1]
MNQEFGAEGAYSDEPQADAFRQEDLPAQEQAEEPVVMQTEAPLEAMGEAADDGWDDDASTDEAGEADDGAEVEPVQAEPELAPAAPQPADAAPVAESAVLSDPLQALEQRWTQVAERVEKLKQENRALKASVAEREAQLAKLAEGYTRVKAKVEELQQERAQTLGRLENLVTRVKGLDRD